MRLMAIRQAGLGGDRSEAPELVAVLREGKDEDPVYVEYALRALAHLGAYEALPEVERVADEKGMASRCARIVKPCVATYGPNEVREALRGYLLGGTEEEKAGAERALYWAGSGPGLVRRGMAAAGGDGAGGETG